MAINNNKTKKRISFRQKNPTKCPICSYEFHREEMLTGGGRLIAGELTDELRRLYEDNQKYGRIYPLAYMVTVCPRCLYAAYPMDVNKIKPDEIEKTMQISEARINSVRKLFGNISFEDDRNLKLGAASYLLAVDSYSYRGKDVAPTFKRAVSSIRAAWLFSDLALDLPEKPYKKVSEFFYMKAYEFYHQALNILQSGGEILEDAGNIGPDYEKNWGYEGVLYMCAILTVKFGSKEPDMNKRIKNFQITKRYLSKLFGDGKSNKSKPGAMIDMIRELYNNINNMIDQWSQEIGEEGD